MAMRRADQVRAKQDPWCCASMDEIFIVQLCDYW
jgi:hypothetical protein